MGQWSTRVDELGPLRIVGLAVVSPTAMNPDSSFEGSKISVLWDDFFALIPKLSTKPDGTFFGVSTPADDHMPPLTMNYVAGIAVTASIDLPDGFTEILVPAGTYLYFTHAGSITNIDQSVRELYGHYLPSSHYVVREAPHLELYDERFDHDSPTCEMDLLVPIE